MISKVLTRAALAVCSLAALAAPARALQYPLARFGGLTLDVPLGVASGGLGNATGDASALTVFSRSLSARASELVNVRDSGALGDGATDDSAAFAAAIGLVNSRAALGVASCLYLPPGQYYLNGATLPAFSQNTGGGVCGAGAWKSVIRLGAAYAGDLFSWSDSWQAAMLNAGGTSVVVPQKMGVRVTGISILGNNASTAQQNGLMLYDHTDFAYINDVDVENLNGRAFYAGMMKNDTASYIRESHIENLRIWNSGGPNSGGTRFPSFEITTQCSASCSSQDASNEIDIGNLDIYGARGPALVLRNANASATQRGIHMSHVRIEGSEGNPYSAAGSSLMIGDAAMSGPLASVRCDACEIVSPYTGYYAIDINTAGAGASLYSIYFSGQIAQGAGGGGGIHIGAGTTMLFDLTTLNTAATGITVASSATVSGPLVFDGGGLERFWTWSVDPTSVAAISNRRGMFGIPTGGAATAFVSAQIPDGGVSFGNARGANSVDWQTYRYDATQVASGAYSTISGGESNRASNTSTTVSGGQGNIARGFLSSVCGGAGNTSFGQASWSCGWNAFAFDYGMMAFSAGDFASPGDAQIGWTILRAATTSTTATRLTADGSGTAGAGNTLNINPNFAWLFDLDCIYRDTTTGAVATWYFYHVLMTQGASAATTTVSAPGATAGPTSGSPGASAPTVGADTTNGGLALTFTAPNSHADHIACGVTRLVMAQ